MRPNSSVLFTLLLILLFAISPFASEKKAVTLVKAFPNLTFTRPVLLTHSNDGSNRRNHQERVTNFGSYVLYVLACTHGFVLASNGGSVVPKTAQENAR